MPQFRILATTCLVVAIALGAVDVAVRIAFPTLARLDANFSPAYLDLVVERLRKRPGTTVVLGDSVLWGHALRADQTAASLLRSRGDHVANLAYEGGSPLNTYAMLELLLARGVRPARVVFNVNPKTFDAADSAYAHLHPSVAALTLAKFAPSDVARLAMPPASADAFETRADLAVSAVWRLYALRSDLREMLFGDVDAAHALAALLASADGAQRRASAAHVAAPSDFEGVYDLTPLDDGNVSAHFLSRLARALHDARLPALAILTPTNHGLLHAFVDTPQYADNLRYERRVLEAAGVRVLDLDRAFAPADFLDNDHLTARANVRLAALIEREINRT